MNERIKKMWYVNINIIYVWCVHINGSMYMEYYSAMKKDEILLFTKTWMALEGIVLTERSQTGKD